MDKTILKITIMMVLSFILLACGGGENSVDSSLNSSVVSTGNDKVESDIVTTGNDKIESDEVLLKPTINIKVNSHAWYKESLSEYETGESFTIHATLVESGSDDTKATIHLESNSNLIYESNECTIGASGDCDINVIIAENASLDQVSLKVTSAAKLEGTTSVDFTINAANIIFYTFNDRRRGDFAKNSDSESASDIVNKWCNDYANNSESSPDLPKRYRRKVYKGMIQDNPATIPGKIYYRDDAKTKVATATSEYLAESLESSVNEEGKPDENPAVWTGVGVNCINWTIITNSNTGGAGYTGSRPEHLSNTWWYRSMLNCNNRAGIYCVSQPNS